MIISPPFLLPVPNSPVHVDPLMDEVDKMADSAGFYPVASDRRWHTGLHLIPSNDGSLPVRAVADGEVVAYRVCQQPIEDVFETKNTNAGFVLLKHSTETGEDRRLTFYSLYMHLIDLERMTADGILPPPEGAPHSMPLWLREDTGGAIPGGGKKVRRKDILGYVGQCQGNRHLHFEIFMTPGDFDAYFGATQLGREQVETPPGSDCWGRSYYLIPADHTFLAQPLGVDKRNKLNGIEFSPEQVGQNENPLWVEVYFHHGDKYTSVWSLAADGSRTALTSVPVREPHFEYDMYKRATALYPACPSDGYELLRFGRILSRPETLGERTAMGSNPRATWYCIPFASGQRGYIDVSKSSIKKLSDADFPFFMGWQKVRADAGVVDEKGLWDLDALKRLVRGSIGDADVDGSDAPAAVQTAQRKNESLRHYVTDPNHKAVLHGFVCEAPSEWDHANLEPRYRDLLDEGGHFDGNREAYDKFLGFVEKLQFWDKTGLPAGERVWFFHPLAFIRHLRRCGWLCDGELSQIYPVSKYDAVGKSAREYRERYRSHINRVVRKYGLNNQIRFSHFLGQCAIESFYMMVVRESAVAVASAIKKNHISILPEGYEYLRSPPAFQNDVAYFERYEGKIVLGNTDAGDGVKFRGRGFKQLTGRYNYSEYWVYRGWLNANAYDHSWFKKKADGKFLPGPEIGNPQIVGDDAYSCVDTAGFFCARYIVAKSSDGGVTEKASLSVTKIVNAFDEKSRRLRWMETFGAYKALGDSI